MADFLQPLKDARGRAADSPSDEAVSVTDFNRVVGVLNGTAGVGGTVGVNFFASNPPLYSLQTIAYAATITPDGSKRSIVNVGTLTGNITVNAPTNPATGAELVFIFTMGGAGNYATNWDVVFKTNWNAAIAVGAISSVTMVYDGTNWQMAQPNIIDQNGNTLIGGLLRIATAQTGNLFTVRKDLTDRLTIDDTGLAILNGILRFDPAGTSNQVQLKGVAGVNGRRLSVENASGGSAEIQLVPGNTSPNGGLLNSQIQWFNVSGNNYERMTITAVSNQFVIDTTALGTGTVRNIVFQAEGTVAAGAGQNALEIYSDASVDLNGANFSANGATYGGTRTRIADWTNSGSSSLIIDTRTGTPASNVADTSGVRFSRGGTLKWFLGLNVLGANADNFDISPQASTGKLVYQGSQTSGNNVFTLKNTDGSGHQWDIGEMFAAGSLSFRDFTAAGQPETLRLSGATKVVAVNAGGGLDTIAAGTLALGLTTATAVQVGRTGQSVGFYGAVPVVKAGAITTPTAPSAGYVQAEAASAKTAIDAIRVALTNIGITA